MEFCEINPFVRVASRIFHRSEEQQVWVPDCRLFYVLAGQVTLYVQGLRYEMQPGGLFYCRSGICYGLVSEGVDLICLNFDLDQRNRSRLTSYPRISLKNRQPPEETRLVSEETFLNSYLYLPEAGQYLQPLQSLLEEFSIQKICYRESCSGILKNMLLQLHRQSIAASSVAEAAVTEAITYIKNNFAQPLTNALLSERSGYHPYHLNRLFLQHTGTSIHQYILNTRISEAKKLLLNTELSLAQIAEMVGFNSNTHFSGYFRQTVGISPLNYRKQFKNRV